MMNQSAPQSQAPQQEQPAQQTEVQNPAPQTPKEDPFEQKFAILSKKQKAIFEKEKELEERMRKIKEIEERDSLFDKNPLEYITKKGKSLDDILRMAAGEDDTPESKIEMLTKKIAEFERREKEAEEKKQKDEESRKQQEIIDNYKKDVKLEIEADPDRFEAIIALGEFDSVFEVIQNYYQTHGEVPPTQWAADEVEKELVEQARKFGSLKKLASAPSSDENKAEALKTVLSEQKTTGSTITTSLTPEPQGNKNNRLLSDEESKAQVARMLRWNT